MWIIDTRNFLTMCPLNVHRYFAVHISSFARKWLGLQCTGRCPYAVVFRYGRFILIVKRADGQAGDLNNISLQKQVFYTAAVNVHCCL